MPTVAIELELALELVDTKLAVINNAVENILEKFGEYGDPQQFFVDYDSGFFEVPEDTINILHQLLKRQEEFLAYKRSWESLDTGVGT